MSGLPPEAVTAAHAQRIAEIDTLVAPASVPVPGQGTSIDADGAIAVYTVADTDPQSRHATWSELRRQVLAQIRVAGPDAAAGMRRLLAAWRELLADEPVPGHGESTAVLSWPSRDAEVVRVLRGSGLTATAVLAARTAAAAAGRPADGEVTVRVAQPRDTEAVAGLHEALTRWDDHFGGAYWRASTPARMCEFAAELIGSQRPRAWVAEAAGQVVATCDVEWPESAGWVSSSVAASPADVAYIGSLCVAAEARGAGIGTLLVSHVHRELDQAGVKLPLVHYAPLNPLSAPFWHRAGYRPVITTWKAQPHTVLRDG